VQIVRCHEQHAQTASLTRCLTDHHSLALWHTSKSTGKKKKHRKAAVFLQLAYGHALIGTHLVRRKKKESDAYWWCDSGRKQSRGHLFGGCRAWKRECLALKKRVERLTGKKRKRGQRRSERGARLKVVDLFKDERLTEAVLEFLKDTEIGRRYE
jgi:hypothetical protein